MPDSIRRNGRRSYAASGDKNVAKVQIINTNERRKYERVPFIRCAVVGAAIERVLYVAYPTPVRGAKPSDRGCVFH